MSDAVAGRALVLATRNAHKLIEIARLLEPAGSRSSRCPTTSSCRPRTASTFADNALVKAQAAAAQTGRPRSPTTRGSRPPRSVACPGAFGAIRRPDATDEQNLEKLVSEAPADSRLRYVCALAYVNPQNGEERVFFGDCRGRLARERSGIERLRLRPGVRSRRRRATTERWRS